MCHDNEEWCKIWRRIELSFQNWQEKFEEFLTQALKSLKNLHFNGLHLTNEYNVCTKKYRGIIFHDTEEW